MNRCHSSISLGSVARAATLGIAMFTGLAAWSQVYDRPFPPAVKRGALTVTQPPEITLDGKPDRLSPGSRIRGTNNMLVSSAALVGQNLVVNYLREPTGMVHEVWILTESEAAKKLPAAPQ